MYKSNYQHIETSSLWTATGIMMRHKVPLLIVMTVLLLVSSFTSFASTGNRIFLEELPLPDIPEVFANHGQEVSLILNSGYKKFNSGCAVYG